MSKEPLKSVSPTRIILPILIGLVTVAYLFYKEFNPNSFSQVNFTWLSGLWIFMACLCMVGRDLGYMIRIRVLSENKLNWRQAFRIIMLWEFTSAVTPSSVGGTSVALVYIHKEGLTVGRSSAIVMVTSLLDELYFVVMFPLMLWLLGAGKLLTIPGSPSWTQIITASVWIAYLIKLVWVLLLSYGFFMNPRGLSKLVFRIFHLPFLRRWRRGAARAASDISITSVEMRNKDFNFWVNALLSTFLSWTSRYWVVNCLLLAFFPVNGHPLVFGRQLIMSIVLLVAPTPGGSGFAEKMFSEFLGDFIPIAGFSIALALLWRIISYYPYLAIGALVVPKWVNDKFIK